MINSLLGTPYRKLGKTENGFDCWGLVWYLYKHVKNIDIDYRDRLFTEEAIQAAFVLCDDHAIPLRRLQRKLDFSGANL